MSELPALSSDVLPAAIRARFVSDINGLRLHVLEAGSPAPGRPVVLLPHGFPELAYSWRKMMPALAAAGFHVIAPDQRGGYGRTTGWSANYDDDLRPFRLLNAVRDAVGLVAALGYRSVASVVGHDFGASIAAWCALVRPDVFRSVAFAPFGGPPDLPFDTERHPPGKPHHPRGAGGAAPAAQALSVVVLDPVGECSDLALPAGCPRLPARLFPSQER
jgi:pimeloyl-ACP methyl ester carboxylesterase